MDYIEKDCLGLFFFVFSVFIMNATSKTCSLEACVCMLLQESVHMCVCVHVPLHVKLAIFTLPLIMVAQLAHFTDFTALGIN